MRPHHEPRAPALAPGARVLVTGGAGFLGSHLVEELLQRSCKVQALDDLSSGAVANVEHLLGEPAFALHVGNAEDERLVERLVAGADVVFHLAGAVGVGWLAREPATVMQRNLRCTEVVLHACAGQHKPVLFTSSSEVYGDGPVPFVEHAQLRVGATTSVRGGYACAKAMGEWLAAGLAQQHGLRAVVARVFNTVGARQVGHGGMVLPRFVEQALRGEPITVYGDGSQTRCFAHASETARALCDLMAHPAVSGAYNVGSDAEVTVANDGLWADRAAIDVWQGASVNFVWDGGAARAGRFAVLLASASGTTPGVPIAPGVTLPLVPDPLTVLSLDLAASGAPSFAGALDPNGRRQSTLAIPGGVLAPLLGLELAFAWGTLGPIDYASNPVRIALR